jgi:16S rRNA (guanine527-N7)-methyltransferase
LVEVKEPNQTSHFVDRFAIALQENAKDFHVLLDKVTADRLRSYYELLLTWNERLHLVAPCSPEEFATRHVLESLLLLRHLQSNARVIEVGSGAGLPIIPCLIARNDLCATLIESSQKKAVFLREALRDAGMTHNARVIAARFEETPPPAADYVTSRALDRFAEMLPTLVQWSPSNSTLLLFGGDDLRGQVAALFPELEAERVPQSKRRFLLVVNRHQRLP